MSNNTAILEKPQPGVSKRKVVRRTPAAAKPKQIVVTRPPTETSQGWRVTVTLSERLQPIVAKLAKAFQMTPRQFLHAYYLKELPVQSKLDSLEETLDATRIAFSCHDKETLARIERTAAFKGKSVLEMVARNVAGDVDCYEGDMILHPNTGEVVGDRFDFDKGSYPDISHELIACPLAVQRSVAERKKGREELQHYSHTDPDYEGRLYRAAKGRYEVDDDLHGPGQKLDAAGVVAFLIARHIPDAYHGEFAASLPVAVQTEGRTTK